VAFRYEERIADLQGVAIGGGARHMAFSVEVGAEFP
jgi:hypothetical protein